MNNAEEEDKPECFVGAEFSEGFVAMLSQVKYFLNEIDDMEAMFADKLVFQGSNDGNTYTDLHTSDSNTHEGWNYIRWEEAADQPKFRFYRFKSVGGSCKLNEVKFQGVEVLDEDSSTKQCPVKLIVGGAAPIDLNADVTYDGDLTPVLESITPRHGTVKGGDSVTFQGAGFSQVTGEYTILIDGFACAVTSANANSVTCTTAKRPGLHATSLHMYINGKGKVSTKDHVFTYVNMWSDSETWGGDFAPVDGEMVHLPAGMNLFVDIDRSPVLRAVLVEGQLIFAPNSDPNHQRFFDAYYIFINGGSMEVGTEEHPYTSKITFTMHGNQYDPFLPIYGNKVIGVRNGVLDMHGVKRNPTWTVISKSTEVGDNKLTLARAVDW